MSKLTESEIVALRNRLLEKVSDLTKAEHKLLHALEDTLMLDFGYEPLIWQAAREKRNKNADEKCLEIEGL